MGRFSKKQWEFPSNLLGRPWNSTTKPAKIKDTLLNKEPEFLVPVDKAPYYAVRVIPSTMGTIGGLQTNNKFQSFKS